MPSTRMERKSPRRRAAGRPRKYSGDLLVDAALRVMEREGYRALSLRSLAHELKTSHTTLYNYVDAIEEIEAKALDRLSQQLPVPDTAADRGLRAQLLAYLISARALLLQHPGVLLSPPDSPAGKRLNAVSDQWQHVLQSNFQDPQGGRLALTLLTSAAVVTATRDLVFKADPRGRQSRNRVRQDAEVLERLLPGLGQGRATRPDRPRRAQP